MLSFFQKMFDNNERDVKRIERGVVEAVNALEPTAKDMEHLPTEYAKLRERYGEGETLDELLPECFALVRESARRNLGLRHYDVQLIGGAALHQGKMAEMKTGEGKTLVATLALALNAIPGKGTHLVTTNDYLVQTGAEWMGPIYRGLGLTVGAIQHSLKPQERRAAYGCDITYMTNSELGFDYLRDNMAFRPEQLVLREQTPLHYAIIDEVDSILIDEARTPLIISGPAEVATDKYYTMAKLVKGMERGEPAEGEEKPATGDYSADEKTKDIHLTEQGIEKAEKMLGIEDIFSAKNMELGHMVRQALRAKEHYHPDKQYVKDDNGADSHCRRVHGSPHAGASLRGGLAPSHRSERGRQDRAREPDARDRNLSELLQVVRQNRGDDGYGENRGEGVSRDLLHRRAYHPHQQARHPR